MKTMEIVESLPAYQHLSAEAGEPRTEHLHFSSKTMSTKDEIHLLKHLDSIAADVESFTNEIYKRCGAEIQNHPVIVKSNELLELVKNLSKKYDEALMLRDTHHYFAFRKSKKELSRLVDEYIEKREKLQKFVDDFYESSG